VTDADFRTKFRVAVAIYTIFFILLLGGTGFIVMKFLKNRKQMVLEQKSKDEYEKTV
jgi:hypothetical protein